MTQAGIELVRAERRRRWTRAEKERLVAASFEPGVSTSDVARRAGLHVSQLFRWRKLLCEHVGASTPALGRGANPRCSTNPDVCPTVTSATPTSANPSLRSPRAELL